MVYAWRTVEMLAAINDDLIECRKCPRLVAWREQVAHDKKAAHRDEVYWGRPVPLFGDAEATKLILGLAPAAHGANRTGRMFTGDRSGDWIYRALHRAGIANQAEARDPNDGLALRGAVIAATAHCAPPGNKPTPEEIAACSVYLRRLLAARPFRAAMCLGGIAWNHLHRVLEVRPPVFRHGAEHLLPSGLRVFASYHPSQQNTFTGRLTEAMLDDVVQRFARA